MKRALVIGTVAVVVVGAGSAYGWREWTHSPTYSLKQVASAVEHRDRYELEKYVDIDSVLRSAVADATDGNPLASALGGAVLTQLKPQIIKAIEDGSVPADSQFGKGIQKTLGGQLPQIERQGRNAYFAIDVTTKGGAPFALKIHMTQVPDGYWRIDRIANMKELRALEEQEEAARKAAIARANEEKLSKLVVAAKLHTSVRDGWERKNRFQVRFENKGERTITGLTGHIRVASAGFDHGIRGELEIAPGATDNGVWEFAVNQFIADTERVYALGETDQFDVDIDSLAFSDGTKVARGDEP